MYLHRLVYYAESKIRELGLPVTSELKAIIASSRKNNPAAGITGVLAFNEQYFVGVIEGDRRRVSSLLLRVARDKRAGNFTVLSAGAVDTRLFDDWLPLYAGHSETVDRLYLRHGLTQGLDPVRLSAENLLGLLVDFAALDGMEVARHAATGTPADLVEHIKVAPVFADPRRAEPAR